MGFSVTLGRCGLVTSGLIDEAGRRVVVCGISAMVIATELGLSVATISEKKLEIQ